MAKRAEKQTKGTSVRQRREEKRREQMRRRNLQIVIGIVVILAIGAIIFFLVNQPQDAPIPEGTLERYAGLPQGFDEETGFPILGNPAAPVRVVEASSFSCSACEVFHDTMIDDLVQLVREGRISYIFVPNQFTGNIQNAAGAARGAICAGRQGKFWEFHDMLFDWQTRFGNAAFSQNRMVSGADALGLDVGAFRSCLGSGFVDDLLDASVDWHRENNIQGTPTTFVNGVLVSSQDRQALLQQIDIAQGNQPPAPPVAETETTETDVPEDAPQTEATPEITPEATTEAGE
ncbi:MAG: hypothetical protein D6711_00055 [Chloroflexi bacterium]|nr:MAG: hypothetical protein D6711_00055 [Chloroflexota bacterium]